MKIQGIPLKIFPDDTIKIMRKNLFNKDNLFLSAWIVLIVISVLVSQLLLYSRGFYAISADEAGHTLDAYQWYMGRGTLFSIWLPFQKVLYGTAFNIFYDLIWIPRILSSVFGYLTIFSLVFLTYELFSNKIVSLLTGFLGSTFPCLVIFSVIPMSEIFFFFFTITSIAFLLRWERTKSPVSLIFLIITSGIGTAIRYEAWIFSVIIFIILFFEFFSGPGKLSSKLLKISGIFILLFAFPLYWMYLSYGTTGEITAFLHSVSGRYAHKIENYSRTGIVDEIKNNVLYYFIILNLSSLNILGLTTLAFFFKKEVRIKVYVLILFATLLIVGLATFFSKAMPTHNAWRIASVWSIMLLPFTAQWLYLLLSDDKLYIKRSFFVFIILLVYFFNLQTLHYTKISYISREDLKIGNYISALEFRDSDSKIYIERNNWYYTSLLVTSQNPDRFIIENNDIMKTDSIGIEQVMEYKKSGIEYLILAYRVQLNFDTRYLREIKKFSNWTIYKLL